MTDFDRIKDLASKELTHALNLVSEDDPDRYSDVAAALRQVALRYDALVEERAQVEFGRVDDVVHRGGLV